MAEGFAREWLQRNGFADYTVISRALTDAYEPEGSPASTHGVELMNEIYNIDISAHRSRMLTLEDVRSATYMIGVSKSHESEVRRRYADDNALTGLMALNRDISDPWHQGRAVYEFCAAMMKKSVEETLASILQR